MIYYTSKLRSTALESCLGVCIYVCPSVHVCVFVHAIRNAILSHVTSL